MSSLVKISSHFKSSARVNESNFEPAIFLKHFIVHGTVLQTLDSLGAELMARNKELSPLQVLMAQVSQRWHFFWTVCCRLTSVYVLLR